MVIRRGRIIAAVAVVIAAVLSGSAVMSAAATKQVRGKGRLVSSVLVFASLPKGDKKTDFGYYQVYFRTAAGFAEPGHESGTLKVDDAISYGSDDLSQKGGGRPSGRCYLWTVVTTRKLSPQLTRKQVGDPVTVRLHAYHTALQVRKVRMHAWPSSANSDPAVKKAVAKIGCHA